MRYTFGDLKAAVVRDMREVVDTAGVLNDDVLSAVINQGLSHLVNEGKCLRRTATVPAVIGQASYSVPPDFLEVERDGVWFSDRIRPLDFVSVDSLPGTIGPDWRDAANGVPQYRYEEDPRYALNVTPPPATADPLNFRVRGLITTYACGEKILTIAIAGGTATVATSKPHGLVVGDAVAIHTPDTPALAAASVAVASVPTATTFTYATEATGSATAGIVHYAGGTGPLYGRDDVPPIWTEYHSLLIDFAVLTLCTGLLHDADGATLKAEAAAARFEPGFRAYMERIRTGGLSLAPAQPRRMAAGAK